MSEPNVISLPAQSIAPTSNVSLCTDALSRAMERPEHLPGLVGFYGPSGFGKSMAATHAANRYRAYYVEAKSVWTRKSFLQAILREIGVPAARTIAEMCDQVAEQLVLSRRPLIVDEVDYLIDKHMIPVVRDIYESSGVPILLIGEERLEASLRAYERIHNRVLEWVEAQPTGLADAQKLARLYCRDIQVADDLLERIVQVAAGGARRVAVNLNLVRDWATRRGVDAVDLAAWGDQALYTGSAPLRGSTRAAPRRRGAQAVS
jgi:DNA transposition AAA+ family ATPase